MKVGIYPGSFNPWHAGHTDIVRKALQVFDTVYVVVMSNENKGPHGNELHTRKGPIRIALNDLKSVEITQSPLTLLGLVEATQKNNPNITQISIIRGLRNSSDLQYEMNNQYWNEDVGLNIPFVYFITDRTLAHVSSSSIRAVNQLKLNHPY